MSFRHAVGMAALATAFLLGIFGGAAIAAAPKNTVLPTISPSTPHATKEATASTGTWNSESPAHWLQLKEGEKASITAHGNPITFAATVGGVKGSVICETTVTGASLENPSGGGGGVGNAEIGYKNCKAAGGWASAGCKATFGAAVPVKLELTTVEGKAKIKLSPVGADLGTFILSECLIADSYKLVGVINGFYSNAGSQIEFNPETTATGLRLGSTLGPKATATGTIGLEMSGGGNVGADSLTYTYAWNRCSGGKCSAIAGATKSTYTPVAADVGKKLTVSVTATDAIGGTTATSAETGSVIGDPNWYVCGKWGEPGVYENSSCTKKGASNPYSWLRATSTPFTSSNILEKGEGRIFSFNWTTGGVAFEIVCTGASGEGTLSNTESQANIGGLKLTLSGCWYTGAPLGMGCQISSNGGAADYKMVFNTLKGSSQGESTTEVHFEPEGGGGTLLEFWVKNCEIAGSYRFTGWFPALFHNEGSFVETTSAEVKVSGGMKFMSSTGPVAGITSANRVLSEGEKPVKLDVTP